MMAWDDDEDYVPPNNVNFFNDQARPQIFGNDDQFNSLVFSTEELKLQYHMLKFVSKEWTSKQAPEIRNSIANLQLIKHSNEDQFSGPDYGEVRDRGVTMGITTLADEQRHVIGQLGHSIIQISKGYKHGKDRVLNSLGPIIPSPKSGTGTIVNVMESPRDD